MARVQYVLLCTLFLSAMIVARFMSNSQKHSRGQNTQVVEEGSQGLQTICGKLYYAFWPAHDHPYVDASVSTVDACEIVSL